MVAAPEVALVAATGLHAGFQLVVTGVAYPALASTPPAAWRDAHAAHTRRIVPLVAVVYAGLLGAAGWVLASGPGVADLLAVASLAAVLGVTALVAGPAHGRLARGHDAAVLHRLLVADRWRLVLAVAALGSALVAGWG